MLICWCSTHAGCIHLVSIVATARHCYTLFVRTKMEGTPSLVEYIERWQETARSIARPEGTDILPTRGGLSGPAFFPEGFGLQNPTADAVWPDIMAIGHNFGCEDYRKEIDAAGREDDKPLGATCGDCWPMPTCQLNPAL